MQHLDVNEDAGALISERPERLILGTLVLDGATAFERCMDLRAEHFALSSYGTMYRAISELYSEGVSVDLETLRQGLERKGQLHSVGGLNALLLLTEDLPRRFDTTACIAEVIDSWRRREAWRIASALQASAGDLTSPIGESMAAGHAALLDAIAQRVEQDEPLVHSYSVAALNAVMAECDGPRGLRGLTYGVDDLDDFTHGMMPGQVVVVGARSGIGKSSLMLQAAHANAKRGTKVHIFSLEMNREECLQRLWSIESGVSYEKIYTRELSRQERSLVSDACMRISEWQRLRIDDRADMQLSEIVARSRVSIRRHGTQLICVDYAQNVETEGRDERIRVMNVSRTLTKMAKTEKISLMLLSQLTKETSKSENEPPKASELRETAQLRNDAHVIILMHRHWDETAHKVLPKGLLIIPKNRNGKTGALEVYFQERDLTFSDQPFRVVA